MELWKVGKMQSCFPTGQFFSILPKYWQVSKYTAMLSKFSFPKKGNKNKSNFRMVNLCNGGTKDFVELWEIIHLNIWTQLTQSITVKPVQTTTSVKRPRLGLPKQIPFQSLLYKTSTCPTRPATTFFDSQIKKTV